MKRYLSAVVFLITLVILSKTVFAETPTPTPTSDTSVNVSDLQNKINDLQSKISSLQGQEKTLSSQIAVMDNQIKLTELRIASTKQQIADLTLDIDTADKKIGKLEGSLDNLSEVLINRIKATYVAGKSSEFQILITSGDVSDYVKRTNYLRIAQQHDKRLIYDTVQAKNDYANQKEIFQVEKTKAQQLSDELDSYQSQLEVEKSSKNKLLAETQGSEANYQSLLSQAKAQLAGFSNFTDSQGGASLLSGQTACDDWGCYYNQRDSQWGGSSLNGTGYTLASDGCLVTSMAMIYSHYGYRNVNPATINSNPSNFASYYPAFLLKVISADGVTARRVYDSIDSVLATGHPLVIGISYDGGPMADHFVVFTGGAGGNYTMNDPFTPNGKNISFRERYPTARIVDVEKVVL